MPAPITLEKAYDRLFDLMPDWRVDLTASSWIPRWREASNDSRATAYRMLDLASRIDDAIFQEWMTRHPIDFETDPTGSAAIEAHNRFYGLPCPWLEREHRFNDQGQRVAA